MNKHLAPVALSVGLLGLVGGVAAANAFAPTDKPAQRQVEVVVPAAETVTPEPAATTTTVAPKPAPKKVAPKPVESAATAEAPAPAPVQRQAVVSEPAPEPQPQATTQDQPASPGNPPPVRWGSDVPTPPISAK